MQRYQKDDGRLFRLRSLNRVFLTRARAGCEHSASLKSVNTHNKHGGSIRSHNRYLKKCVKKQLNSFYVMESWVSSNCTSNIYRPSTPEKEVNRKEDTVGKIAKRRQIVTDSKVYASWIQILARFYSITWFFATKEIGIFRVRFIAFPWVEFPKICWTVKHICALLVLVDRKKFIRPNLR